MALLDNYLCPGCKIGKLIGTVNNPSVTCSNCKKEFTLVYIFDLMIKEKSNNET